MANTPSTEACSALIEYWAKEYERLLGRSSSGKGLTEELQIPPEEMKKYIENYKKWYETPVPQEETKAKLSILKRISEAWQLNVDTINKLIKYMESTLAVFAVMLICGCRSGLYKVSTSEDSKQIDESVRYYAIGAGSFIKDNGSSPDGVLYDEDRMPIQIIMGQSQEKFDDIGVGLQRLRGMLFTLSLGVFPMWRCDYLTQGVTIKSPIGERSGSYRVDAKYWEGWLPIFVGYPGSADERCDWPLITCKRIEDMGKNRLVKKLVGEFSYKDYVAFAKSKNGERKAEISRIKSVSGKVDELLAKNRFDDAATLIEGESKPCSATQECDGRSWSNMRERVAVAHQTYDKKHAQTLIATGKYEEAISFCNSKNTLSDKDNDELKDDAVKTAVEALNDAKRLIAFLELIEEVGMRDEVVMKLKSLNSLLQLPKEQLVEIANTTGRDDVVLSVIGVITDKSVLVSFLDKKRSTNVLKALLERIADADAVRTKIWDGGKEDELCVYASVFGSDDECLKLIKAYPDLLTDVVLKEFKTKISKEETKSAIDELQTRRLAAEISVLEGAEAVARIKAIGDESVRSKIAKSVLYKLKDNGRGFAFYDTFYLYSQLVSLMSYDDVKSEAQKIVKSCEGKIHFEGYYVGMPLREYYILYAYRGLAPDLPRTDFGPFRTDMKRIEFDRTLRYKFFEKEDGEFWSAYLRKYVPSRKQQKSLTEAIVDALDDSGTYDYQSGYDDELKEFCYIYKSMKYGTKVIFGQKTGKLVLEEYK